MRNWSILFGGLFIFAFALITLTTGCSSENPMNASADNSLATVKGPGTFEKGEEVRLTGHIERVFAEKRMIVLSQKSPDLYVAQDATIMLVDAKREVSIGLERLMPGQYISLVGTAQQDNSILVSFIEAYPESETTSASTAISLD